MKKHIKHGNIIFITQRTRQTTENHQPYSTPYWTSTIATYSYMIYPILNPIFASNKVPFFKNFANFYVLLLSVMS